MTIAFPCPGPQDQFLSMARHIFGQFKLKVSAQVNHIRYPEWGRVIFWRMMGRRFACNALSSKKLICRKKRHPFCHPCLFWNVDLRRCLYIPWLCGFLLVQYGLSVHFLLCGLLFIWLHTSGHFSNVFVFHASLSFLRNTKQRKQIENSR